MLEFLGLQSEAVRVFICFVLMGIFLGLSIGSTTAKGKDAKLGVFGVICIIATLIALFICAWPLVMLFFTFQWKWILIPLVIAVAVGAGCFALTYSATMAKRKRKYKKNPIVKEAVAFCRENNIVGIQCHKDRIRFYDFLQNSEYCKSHIEARKAATDMECTQLESSDFRPDSWKAYDHPMALKGEIKFADRGYPDLEELDLFAKALTSCFKGFGMAEHKAYVEYTGYHKSPTTGISQSAHHYIYIWDDRFIFSKKAKADIKKIEAKMPKIKKEDGPEEKQEKPKTWE